MNSMNAPRIMVWITIIQFTCTLLFYWYTFTKISTSDGESKVDKAFNQKTQTYIADLERKYQEKQEKYQQAIDSLNSKLFVTEIKLSKAITASKRDQILLKESLAQKWDTMKTEDKLWACDTLRDQVEHYLYTSAKKDTLYNQKIEQLENIEDTLIKQLVTCDTTKERIVTKLEQSLDQNKELTKEVKKQKRRKNIFKIGVGVLAGLGIFLAVK